MSEEQRISEHMVRVCTSIFADGVEISDLVRNTTGWETDIYAFTLRHGPALAHSEPMILRLYSGEDAPEKAERECSVMRVLHAASYPVPRIWAVETASMPLGGPFLLMERIEGPILLDAMVEAEETHRGELLTRFCETLAGLHALDWRIAPPVLTTWIDAVNDPTAPYGYIDAELARFRRRLERFSAVRPLMPVFRWLEAHRDEVPCRRPAITHGDYHPINVLLRANGSPVVIDWGAVAIADPRRDLAWTLLLAHTPGYVELYEPILPGYEQVVGEAVEQLGYFEVMAACRRFLDVLVSLHAGADSLGMRPGAEALMRRQEAHLRMVYAVIQERTGGIAIPEIEALLDELG